MEKNPELVELVKKYSEIETKNNEKKNKFSKQNQEDKREKIEKYLN